MTQGSALTPAPNQQVACLAEARQRALFQQTKENSALCYGIEQIAINCQNEGYVTLEQAENIQHLASQLRRGLEAMADKIASA